MDGGLTRNDAKPDETPYDVIRLAWYWVHRYAKKYHLRCSLDDREEWHAEIVMQFYRTRHKWNRDYALSTFIDLKAKTVILDYLKHAGCKPAKPEETMIRGAKRRMSKGGTFTDRDGDEHQIASWSQMPEQTAVMDAMRREIGDMVDKAPRAVRVVAKALMRRWSSKRIMRLMNITSDELKNHKSQIRDMLISRGYRPYKKSSKKS